APGWRAYDLATYRWIWTWQTPAAAEARWAEFMAGYRERRSPRALDLTAVPLFVALRELWVVGAQVSGMGARWGRWWVSDGYFDKRLQFLRDWEERHPEENTGR
ncbi:MAG TPA: hypothetical protein VG370_02120, partial [Chloroflexota bacterium]|nr:hypothetical protein [Chloroflexota bacterium]